MVRQLRDMHQPIGSRQNLDKRPEVHDLPNRAHVDLPDFDFFGNPADHFLGLLGRGSVDRRDRHGSAVVDIDLDSAIRDDAADRFAARTDDFPNLVLLDLHREDPWRVGRQRGPWRLERLLHTTQNVQPSGFGLLQSLLHQGRRNTADLDVHL